MKTLKLTRIPFLILLLLFFCAGLNKIVAQDTLKVNQAKDTASAAGKEEISACAVNLKNAETSFTKGQVEVIPGLLSECLKSGFTREEALSAYKLLIQTLLFKDKLREADSSMLAFLKSNPEYKLSQTDHSSFVALYNTFVVRPVLLLSIRAGLNIPYLTFVEQHPTSGTATGSTFKTDASNIFFSVEGKFKILPKLEAGIGIGLSQMKFTNQMNYYDWAKIQYIETQTRIEIPVSVTYDLPGFGKFTPYVRGGLGFALNVSTQADIQLIPTDRNNQYSRTGGTLDIKDTRIPLDVFGHAGLGLKFKIPRGFLFVEARTNVGIFDQNNKKVGTYTQMEDTFYMYSSPDFRLNTFTVNLGYTYIFYKPSKKTAK